MIKTNAFVQPLLQHYLEQFQSIPSKTSALWKQHRQSAMDSLINQGLPTTKDENWRYVARSLLLQQPFKVAKPGQEEQPALPALPKASSASIRLIWVNGHLYLPSIASLPEYVVIEPILTVMQNNPQLLLEHASLLTAFHTLNILFSAEGFSITIKDSCVSTPCIECWYLSTPLHPERTEPHMYCLRNHIQVGKHSTLQFAQYNMLLNKELREITQPSLCFNVFNSVTLQEGSQVKWGQATTMDDQDVYMGQLAIQQHRDSLFHKESLVSGGGVIRQTTTVDLKEAGAHCQLYGLSGVKKQQHVDHHITVTHHADHTQSDIHYRGIVDDRARASFSGEVIAKPTICQIRSHQGNYNLLLSDTAEVDAKPRLALFTGDIECTHGATVGALDNNALLYLQARGIPETTAQLMLIKAFSQSIWDKMSVLSNVDNALLGSFLDFMKQRI